MMTESRNSEVINYEISKTVKQIQRPVGDIKQISAAVLVADTFDPAANDGEGQWVPMAPEKRDSIRTMVSSALGLDAERGDRVEVVSMPFQKETAEAGTRETSPGLHDYLPYAKYILLLICAFLIYLALVRPMIRTLRGQAVAQQPQYATELPDAYGHQQTKALDAPAALRGELDSFSVTPAQVVKAWLKEG
jgi:flagellar M-ring protein FliF